MPSRHRAWSPSKLRSSKTMRNTPPFRVVVLSGPICSGKSSLSQLLQSKYSARVVKTRRLIQIAKPRTKNSRLALQRAGNALDRQHGPRWITNALSNVIEERKGTIPKGLYVVDSVRKREQIEAIRTAFGPAVYHIHLVAEDDELERRYESWGSSADAKGYKDASAEKTERRVRKLADIADIVVYTDRSSKESVLVRSVALLGLYARSSNPLVDVLVGGQYGSEGKGNIVAHIAPEYDLLVRVGGPNAGHKVYACPKPEVYYHLPSGTGRAGKARLLLGAGAVIHPKNLLKEIANSQVDAERLSIDPNAVIIEDCDLQQEADVLASIGSTGQGVGAASARKIMGRGIYGDSNGVRLARDVNELKPFIGDAQQIFEQCYTQGKKILLEGTQGTMLSIHHGEYPHVTSRDTSVSGCLADAGIAPSNVNRVVMVCRTYPIRVGGPSGPIERELTYDQISQRSGVAKEELRRNEKTTTTGRLRRFGEFDWWRFKRAVQLNGPTDIALTFVDYLGVDNRDAYRYEQLSEDTLRFIEEVERVSGRPVSLISTAFNWRNIIDRRSW